MGRMILILIAGASFLFAIATMNINRSSSQTIQNAINKYEAAQAKNNAKSSIEYAIKQLFADTNWSGANQFNLYNGRSKLNVIYTTKKYVNGPDGVIGSGRLITAIGYFGNASDTIRAIVKLTSGIDENAVPPFLEYAVSCGSNMSLNGNVNITDDGNNSWNANVRTNGSFSMNGNNSIHGFLQYTGTATSNPSKRLETDIVPNNNPNNLPSYSKTSALPFPSFNAANFRNTAEVVYNTNQVISGNVVLGTRSNPKVIYVDGDLQLSGNITGYGYFVVRGNIIIKGNVTLSSPDGNMNSIGLYTNGDVNVNGNVQINAQIYAEGNVNLGGNTTVHGSVSAKRSVNFNGNVDIYYKPPNPKLSDKVFPEMLSKVIARPKTVSYY